MESANSAIIRWRRDGIVTYFNEYAQALFGYGADDVIGKSASILVPEQDSAGADLTGLVREVVGDPDGRATNVNENVRRDGSRLWMLWTNRPIYDEQGELAEILAVGTDITDRKRTEEAVKKSEARLVEAQRLAQVGDWEWNLATDDVIWSRETHAIFGRDPDLAAPGFTEDQVRYYTPASWARLNSAVQRAREAGEPYDLEIEVVREDGVHRWLIARGEPVPDAAGAIAKLRGTVQDITERKRAGEALRESEERFRSLVESINDSFMAVDRDWHFTYINRRAIGYTGLSPQDAIGRIVWEIFPEIVGTPLEAFYRAAMESPDSLTYENQSAVVSGRTFELHAYPSSDGLSIFGQDVTGRKRAEEALRESEAKYRNLFLNDLTGDFIADVDGRILDCNPAFIRMLGFASLEEALSSNIAESYLVPGDRTHLLERVGSEGRVVNDERFRRRRDGSEIHVVENIIGVFDAEGTLVRTQGYTVDDTQRYRAEEALREYAENLRRSNEDLERFAYVSSHDLQEPLRSIVSFSQLLERRYRGQLGQDADEYIEFVVEGGIRMQTLIQDLLAYSRVNTTKQSMMLTDISEVIAGAERGLDLQLREAGAVIRYDEMPTVLADPLQIEQVFSNLASNAIKFRRPDVPLRIQIGARRTGGFWEFSVADNGIGIEKEYFEKIFVIFQRLHTKEAYPGTGIGLAIVKRIVDRHGGTIRVESALGEGTTFFFTLPAG